MGGGRNECAQKCSSWNVKVDASVASAPCFARLVALCDNYNYVTLYAPPPISYRQVFHQCSTHTNHSTSSQLLIHFLLSRWASTSVHVWKIRCHPALSARPVTVRYYVVVVLLSFVLLFKRQMSEQLLTWDSQMDSMYKCFFFPS